jgi:deoxyribodipyrimidine photo-lyase
LVTAEDFFPESLFAGADVAGAVVVVRAGGCGALSQAFVAGAAEDAAARVAAAFGCPVVVQDDFAGIAAAMAAAGASHVVTAEAPTGPVADALAGLDVVQVRHGWDARFWPLATKGFFPFREKIAAGLAAEGVI